MNLPFDPWLAAASFALVLVVTLVVVQLTYNLARARKVERLAWLAAGATALGIGIWAMQFIGMLGWRGPVALRFAPGLTGLSLLPVLLGSAIALSIIVSNRPRLQRIVVGALTLSLAVVLTQQLGLHAICFSAAPEFDPLILLLSGLLALVSSALLLMVLSLRIQQAPMAGYLGQRMAAALLVATGLCGANLSGLLALEPAAGAEMLQGAGTTDGRLPALIGGSNVLLYLAGLMLISWIDRRRLLSTLALSQRKLRSARRFSVEIEEQARELTLALQKSQQRLALAMEGSQDGLWDVDVPSNEILISRRMAMMLGLGTQGLTLDSSAMLDLLEPAQRVRLLRALRRHWSGQQRALDCNLVVWSEGGGRRRSVHLRGSSVLSEQGQPIRVAGSLTDVSLQRQHERELRSVGALLEHHPDALLVIDLSGRIELINAAALLLLGVARGHIVGRPLRGLLQRLRPRPRGLLRQIRTSWLNNGVWSGQVDIQLDSNWQPLWLSVARITAQSHETARVLLCGRRGMPANVADASVDGLARQ